MLRRDASDANATASATASATERHANLFELAELSASRERHGNLTARRERSGNATARRDANSSAPAPASYRQRKEHLVANQVTYFIYRPTTRSYMNIQYDIKVCVCTQIYQHKYAHTHMNSHTQQARQKTGTSSEGKQRDSKRETRESEGNQRDSKRQSASTQVLTHSSRLSSGASARSSGGSARSPSESSTSSGSACLSSSTSLTSTGLSTSTGPSFSPPPSASTSVCHFVSRVSVSLSLLTYLHSILHDSHVNCDTQMEGQGERAVSQREGGVREEPAEAPPRHPRQRLNPRQRKPRPKNA